LGVPETLGARLDETATFNLPPQRFPYGHSKVLAEGVVQEAVADGMDVVIINPVTVIGARDVGFVGGEILRVAREGRLLAAPPGGMGVVSARAVGEGHVLAAERGRSGERYLLNGENVTHRALMEIVAEVVGARPPRLVIPRPLMQASAFLLDVWNRVWPGGSLMDGNQARLSARQMYFDGSKAEQELGFPRVSARESVEEAWAWYQTMGLL
jgi:dihydroflavonol-4-reductase